LNEGAAYILDFMQQGPSMNYLPAAGAIAATLLATSAHCQEPKPDSNITITSQIADGVVTQAINTGSTPLTFSEEIAEQIVLQLPIDRPVDIASAGPRIDQQVADQYGAYIKSKGYTLRSRPHTSEMTLSSVGIIAITVYPDYTQVLIAPGK
jgi:hypothetical protein